MDTKDLIKKIADYEQEAEITIANYHRLKGAAIALKTLLAEEQKKNEKNDTSPSPDGQVALPEGAHP